MRREGRFLAAVCAAVVLSAPAVTVEPENTDEVLTNPGMGICHYCYSSRIWAYGAQQEPGTYTLAVSVGTNYGKPQIALPLEGGIDRVYPIGKVTVAE